MLGKHNSAHKKFRDKEISYSQEFILETTVHISVDWKLEIVMGGVLSSMTAQIKRTFHLHGIDFMMEMTVQWLWNNVHNIAWVLAESFQLYLTL